MKIPHLVRITLARTVSPCSALHRKSPLPQESISAVFFERHLEVLLNYLQQAFIAQNIMGALTLILVAAQTAMLVSCSYGPLAASNSTLELPNDACVSRTSTDARTWCCAQIWIDPILDSTRAEASVFTLNRTCSPAAHIDTLG